MATIEDLISAAQPAKSAGTASVQTLLQGAGISPQEAQAASSSTPPAPIAPSTKTSRYGSGLADIGVGVAQLAGHLLGQEKISPQERAAYGVGPNEDVSFDRVVSEREKAYQAGRAAAGSTGFDWMRTLGNASNPINYMIPGGGAASAGGRIAGAALQGAAVGSLNPVTEPGNFWGGKLWQAGVGGAMGALTGGAIEALSRPLSWATSKVAGLFPKSPGAADAAAQGVIDQTLAPTGIKPTDLPPEMVDGLRDQVRHAIETGGTVDPISMKAQAEAASLPIPIKLPRGQASGDPIQYAAEQELAKQQGKGAPLTQLFTENNQKLIDNIDALGAKDAPTTAAAGREGLKTLARIDQVLTKAKNAAYDAVKDSNGRSAALDADHFYVNATDALHREMATVNNPSVTSALDDIADGKLPLTVETMTKLDKAWGRIQRTTSDGNEAYGIMLLRKELNQTPVSSDVGASAVQAYKMARGLARQQFELADPKSQSFIPGYASMLKGMGDASHDEFIAALDGGTANADPEKWFSQNLVRATPSSVKKLMGFLSQAGEPAKPTMQTLQHAVMGDIRDQVVKGNDEVGRAVFSNNAMSKVMGRASTLGEILPQDTVEALGRLYNTSSRISGVPYKSAVNWSNTAAASANLQAMKEGVGTVGRVAAEAIPGGRAALGAKDVVTDIAKRRAAAKAAQTATEPLYGVPGSGVGAVKRAAYATVPLSALAGMSKGSDEP